MGYKGYFVACHKDKNVLAKSSSGGMFSVFADYVLKKGGIVLGATFDRTEKKVKHIGITESADLDKLRKSKYVYSDFSESIDIIEKAIIDDRYILFTGTPCQAAAINAKFGNYGKLYIVDLFCHGTLEPQYLTQYLDSLGTEIKDVCFREQEKNCKDNFLLCIYDNKGLNISDVYINNPLTYLFLSSEGIRDVCFSCKYAYNEHISDITIGDWDFEYPNEWNELYEFLHPSIVSINNEKGDELFKACSGSFCSCEVGENEDEINWYYRNHNTMKGLWGYDADKKREFIEMQKNKGFLYAAEYSMYERERKLIEKAIAKGNQKLCLYGCGKNGKRISKVISKYYRDCVEIQYFVVTENKEKLETIDNIKIYELQDICDDLYDKTIVITIGKEDVRIEIEEKLIEKGITNYVSW